MNQSKNKQAWYWKKWRASGPNLSTNPYDIAIAKQFTERMQASYGKISLALANIN